ncbi:hypothetical protein [Agriterribacter sp.]|uniref:hypothetical protein n=1 Tax=Agriterribacter sp. TaxID=2821509 RepID=UPI002C0C2105|nr:hypothetical protein [Agriterribacter sp.]HRO45788.1 hypothetical protein [Agriterribacter sp.]HRQ16757.1 hypothetical protein [Agriterribacter sp.]
MKYYLTTNNLRKWYFSVVDIVAAFTDSINPIDYLKKLRKRDSELGSYIGTNCSQVEMLIKGKKRKKLAGNASSPSGEDTRRAKGMQYKLSS